MLVYRTRVGGALVGVAVRSVPVSPGLGTAGPRTPYAITVRYAEPGGRIRASRGRLEAAVPPGTALTVAGWQEEGGEVLVSLRPAAPVRGTGRASPEEHGGFVTDRFRLPLSLQAWGVEAVTGARLSLFARCRPVGLDALSIIGTIRLTLQTATTTFRFRVPFLRLLAAPLPAGCRWTVLGGVTGFHVRVEPGGQITGELVAALRCEGRPARVPDAGGPDIRVIRDVSSQVAQTAAEPAGHEHVLLRGRVALDIYYTDGLGASRWTGRTTHFGTLLELPGLQPGDRLEPFAAVERLTHRATGGDGAVLSLMVRAGVTALRPETLTLQGVPFRLERVVAAAAETLSLTESLQAAGPAGTGGREARRTHLPLPGPPAGWAELAAVLSTPEASARSGEGQWRVRASVGGTPLGEAPYPAPLRAATGGTVALEGREALAVVPGLEQVDATGVALCTTLAWGSPLPPLPTGLGGGETRGTIPLPGAVSRILAISLTGSRLRAVVGLDGVGLHLAGGPVEAPHPPAARPLQLTAYLAMHAQNWALNWIITWHAPDG